MAKKEHTLQYSPEYVPEYNMTIFRVPMGVGEAIAPNAEDDGYSAYVSEDCEDYQAIFEALHAKQHAEENDFSKASVQEIEAKAHQLPVKTEQEIKEDLKAAEERKKKAKAAIEKERKRLQKEIRSLKRTMKKDKERNEWLENNGHNLAEITSNKREWEKRNPF